MRFGKLLIIIFGVFIFFTAYRTYSTQQSPIPSLISPLAGSIKGASSFIDRISGSSNLKNVVEESLAGTRGTYGIVIKNLKTGEEYSQNEHEKFDSASLYKLWVMGTVYEKIDNGDLKGDDKLSRSIAELNKMFRISSDAAELTEGSISLTIDEAIERMITYSDNYSALLLAAKIRNSSISNFIEELDLNESSLGEPPQTSPYDTALFYEKLYKGEIINKDASDSMIEILIRQELNDRIPKYLPKDIKVAHKTGELGGFKHDAGIIFGRDPILFVVLSQSGAPVAAAERIALLSRDVFEYFEGN